MTDNTLLVPGFEHIRPEPDFDRLRRALLRQGKRGELPFLELFADGEIQAAVLARPIASKADDIEFYYRLGYDSAPFRCGLVFPQSRKPAADTAELSRAERSWVSDETASIRNRQDFESYPWPSPDDADVAGLEAAAALIPQGMQFLISPPGGVFENVSWLMGPETMCWAIYDDPGLIADMFDRIGEIILGALARLIGHDRVGGVFFGEDLGFRSATMVSPAVLRKYHFPWLKKIADLCHSHGKLMILHSCGNLEEIMDDLIDFVGIDAKHSFEDAIMPVTDAVRKYGRRIGIVGGVDVDFLARRSEGEVREYVRRIIRECAPSGAYVLGTGNSVANYIPVRNYLAMLAEGWEYRLRAES